MGNRTLTNCFLFRQALKNRESSLKLINYAYYWRKKISHSSVKHCVTLQKYLEDSENIPTKEIISPKITPPGKVFSAFLKICAHKY